MIDAFLRVRLFAECAIAAGVIAAAGVYLSWIVAVAAASGGLALAVVATLERQPESPAESTPRRRALRARDRSEIEASVRQADEDLEDDFDEELEL